MEKPSLGLYLIDSKLLFTSHLNGKRGGIVQWKNQQEENEIKIIKNGIEMKKKSRELTRNRIR